MNKQITRPSNAINLREKLEDLRQRNKDLRVSNQHFLTKLSNDRESSLRNLLATLSIFLFTFSSPLFTDLKILNNYDKQLLKYAWLFLFGSIILGLIQGFIDMDFFEKGIERENKAEKLWRTSLPTLKQFNERSNAESIIFENAPFRTPRGYLVFQFIFLLAGFILLGVVAIFVLQKV